MRKSINKVLIHGVKRMQMETILRTVIPVCFICLLLCGCGKKVDKCLSYKILREHSAVTSISRPDDWWVRRHQAVLDRVKQGHVDLLFIGDSITQAWEKEGNEIWQQYYAKRNAVNMGFGSDCTQHVLWRLRNGEVTGISPKLAVIMIGTNNISVNTPRETADGIITICQELRRRLPETKLLLFAIFPCDEKPSWQRENNAVVSQLAASIADNEWIYYMDIGDKLINSDGTISKDILHDYLHPTAKGYQIWAEAIEPMVAKLMRE